MSRVALLFLITASTFAAVSCTGESGELGEDVTVTRGRSSAPISVGTFVIGGSNRAGNDEEEENFLGEVDDVADHHTADLQAESAIKHSESASRALLSARRRRAPQYETDFQVACPSGTPDNWIQEVTITSVDRTQVTQKFKGRNAPTADVTVDIKQLMVKGGAKLDCTYQENKQTKPFPGTAYVMNLHWNVLDRYQKGEFTHDYTKNMDNSLRFGDGSLTRDAWWRLGREDEDCYAMASYAEVKQSETEGFLGSVSTQLKVKTVNLRAAKLSVCKKNECATRKVVMDCWIETIDGGWEQCDHIGSEGFASAVLARA